jgi:5-methylcytosine-specific restriction endonuclease McrA
MRRRTKGEKRGGLPGTSDDSHVRRERERARALRKTAWWQAELAKGRCHYCGETFKPGELTLDHVVPVSRGGRSVRGNVVTACKACNTDKRAQTPVEMILGDDAVNNDSSGE